MYTPSPPSVFNSNEYFPSYPYPYPPSTAGVETSKGSFFFPILLGNTAPIVTLPPPAASVSNKGQGRGGGGGGGGGYRPNDSIDSDDM